MKASDRIRLGMAQGECPSREELLDVDSAEIAIECPAHERATYFQLADLVSHLHKEHLWTPEAIVRWLKSQKL